MRPVKGDWIFPLLLWRCSLTGDLEIKLVFNPFVDLVGEPRTVREGKRGRRIERNKEMVKRQEKGNKDTEKKRHKGERDR